MRKSWNGQVTQVQDLKFIWSRCSAKKNEVILAIVGERSWWLFTQPDAQLWWLPKVLPSWMKCFRRGVNWLILLWEWILILGLKLWNGTNRERECSLAHNYFPRALHSRYFTTLYCTRNTTLGVGRVELLRDTYTTKIKQNRLKRFCCVRYMIIHIS